MLDYRLGFKVLTVNGRSMFATPSLQYQIGSWVFPPSNWGPLAVCDKLHHAETLVHDNSADHLAELMITNCVYVIETKVPINREDYEDNKVLWNNGPHHWTTQMLNEGSILASQIMRLD